MPHRQPPPAHLSISYERLRDLARRAGHTQTAEWLPIEAGDTRRVLYRQRPGRVDLAEELATTLSQLAGVVEASAGAALTAEAVGILESFERANAITPKGPGGNALAPAVTTNARPGNEEFRDTLTRSNPGSVSAVNQDPHRPVTRLDSRRVTATLPGRFRDDVRA